MTSNPISVKLPEAKKDKERKSESGGGDGQDQGNRATEV